MYYKNRKKWHNSYQNSLISINISSAYYVDSKYIRFINLSFTHKRLQDCKNLPDFQKREGKPPKSQIVLIKITPIDLAVF